MNDLLKLRERVVTQLIICQTRIADCRLKRKIAIGAGYVGEKDAYQYVLGSIDTLLEESKRPKENFDCFVQEITGRILCRGCFGAWGFSHKCPTEKTSV